MKITHYISLFFVSLLCCYQVQAQDSPRLYIIQQNKFGTTSQFSGSNIDHIEIRHGATSQEDSLAVIPKGDYPTTYTFRLSEIDSLTFEEPTALLLQQLADYDNKKESIKPTYSDDYTTMNIGWNNHKNWNLANVHDPSVVKADDGYYYMYQTDASYGNAHMQAGGHFMARRSKDLVNWTVLGPAMKGDAPAWVADSCNALRSRMGLPLLGSTPETQPGYGYWAPSVVRVHANLYRLYYCIVILNYIKTGTLPEKSSFDGSWTERAYIGMMETNDPAKNIWTDKGCVICSSSDKAMNGYARSSTDDWTSAYFRWNAIDPSVIITPEGKHWMIYGSWHSGLCAIELDATTGKLSQWPGEPWRIGFTNQTTYGKKIATRTSGSRWQGSEGPEIIYNPETGYYYLFMAYDELSVAYNTRVARSKNPDGPYYGMDGRSIIDGGECYPIVTHPYKFNPANPSQAISGWVGFSHCGVFTDGLGNWFYSSQARLPANYNNNPYSNAVMMGHVRSIRWTESGWPVVMPERYGAVPQPIITPQELAGTWECINQTYQYAKQNVSTTLTLNADGTLSGTFVGTWEYDPVGQYLQLRCTSGAHVGKLSLCVQRELDWEASPRKATIVFAGYSSNGKKTFWGKKTN